jgi:hypothetical protein
MKMRIIVAILTSCAFSVAIAGSYSVDMPVLCGIYDYGAERGPQEIDLDTSFTTVSNITISVTGYHSGGYWQGGDCTGPMGATIMIKNWYPRTTLSATGIISTNILLSNSSHGYLFANDGKLSFSIENPLMYCINGGGFVTSPWFSLSSVVLTVQGVPAFRIKDIASDGTYQWSQTPNGVTARLECATSIDGSWSTCAVTSLSRTGAVVTMPSMDRYFLRAVYNEP